MASDTIEISGLVSTDVVIMGKLLSNPSPDGADGADGEDGATFIPYLDDDGNLSWTNDKGLENPETKNIRGPSGIGWTEEQITLLETVFANLAYADATTGQTAADSLIASLRGGTTTEDITITVESGKIATNATTATVNGGKIILTKEA